ncbi:uncharacterized protein LOC115887015 [Sitophilus oryzae]|uniref:Uncharacterized protein LOC115887015 n=1 Tax=Sitophilus oryzae TaxID=7048 RepID=A0A6J2YE84_SITOR|nr:uncharacterized protein LOC115887015 [Sitophilus oryzae]
MDRTMGWVMISLKEMGSERKSRARIGRLDGRLHVGRLDYSAGGVGRNICEALGKLGRSSHFISAVGDDQQGRILTRNIPKESSKFIKVFPGRHSAQCIVVLDKNGNCSFLMGDMSIHKLITPEVIEQHENIIKKSPLIVLDGNISEAGMDKALEMAHTHKIPVHENSRCGSP